MKRLIFILILSLLLLALPGVARADFEDGQRVPDAVVAPLMAWVERQVGVKVPALPPVIASHTRLMEVVSHMGPIAGRARALYVGGMVLVDHRAFEADDDTQLSLLVHELVHYAQSFKRNTGWTCPQAKETEAYTLQNKWLDEHDHSPFVSASWIQRMASCPAAPAVTVARAD